MQDKLWILGSPLGGCSHLKKDEENFIISYLNPDGSLDQARVHEIAADISRKGANGVREFPFWPTRHDTPENAPIFREVSGRVETAPEYLAKQRRIAEIYNVHGLRYWFGLFDYCGTKRAVGKFNPWYRLFGDDFFWGRDSREFRERYIRDMIKTFRGLDVGFDVCNEPGGNVPVEFMVDTFCLLIRENVAPEDIILPIDYYLKEVDKEWERKYREFREGIVNTLANKKWETWLKTRCLSPIHGADLARINNLWREGVKPGGQRRIVYSFDGLQNPRPDRAGALEIARHILEQKSRARNQGKVHIEVVYGKTRFDPLDTLLGIAEAYREVFGEYPANHRPGAGQGDDGGQKGGGENWNPQVVEQRLRSLEQRVGTLENKLEA